MNLKICIALLVISIICIQANAQNRTDRDTVFYNQNVVRDKVFSDMFRNKRGVLSLTENNFEFKSIKAEHEKFNFSIPYDQIKSIRPYYGFIIPNRIRIRTKKGETYRLFTYKKKNIIRITRERINNI